MADMFEGLTNLGPSLAGKAIVIISAVIGLVFVLYSVERINVSLNGLYIQMTSDGYCMLNGEPFDRMVADNVFAHKNPSWGNSRLVTNPVYYDATGRRQYTTSISSSSDGHGRCVFTNDEGSMHGRGTSFTPAGQRFGLIDRVEKDPLLCDQIPERLANIDCRYKLSIKREPSASQHSSVPQTDGWVTTVPLLQNNTILGQLLGSLMGLGIPLFLMTLLGSVTAVFISKLSRGENVETVTQIFVVLIIILLMTAFWGMMGGGLETAVTSVDPSRFKMYDSVIGRAASHGLGLWGIMLVAGFLPVAFSLVRTRITNS